MKLRRVEGERFSFHCPGCGHSHVIPTRKPEGWDFNGNMECPTFQPSLLNTHPGDLDIGGNIPPLRCHLYVTNGEIRYLEDCTHALKGKSIPMEDV